jgi:tRNA threonylcarbamoyl adenosine modification protein (Sua5/YciO/YrdC/YwlC family)
MKRGSMAPEGCQLRGEGIGRKWAERLSALLQNGAVLLLPTDTGYCYAGDPHSAQVHKNFLHLRHAHPKHKPFSLICRDIASLSEVSHLSTAHYRMVKKLLPGPFTCIFERHKRTPPAASTQKGKTVGVRIPDAPHIMELLECFGRPLLATSVTDADELELENYFRDFHSPDSWWAHADEILRRSDGLVAGYIDAGSALPMRASTILDFTSDRPRLLRDGGWDMSGINFDYDMPESKP